MEIKWALIISMAKFSISLVILMCLIFVASCVSKDVSVMETYYETAYRTETYTATEDVVVNIKEGYYLLNPIIKWQTGMYFAGTGSSITYYYGYEPDITQHLKNKIRVTISPGAQEQGGLITIYNLTDVGQISPMSTPLGNPGPQQQAWIDNLNVTLNNPNLKLGYQEISSMGLGLQQGNTRIWWDKEFAQHLWIIRENQKQEDLGFFPTKTEANNFLKDTEMDTSFDYIIFDASGIKDFAILANTWYDHPISDVRVLWTDEVTEKQLVTKERQVPYQVEKQRTVTQTKQVPFWEIFTR